MIYITELNEENYNSFTKTGLVLVDIKAEWCGPCKVIEPIIEKISTDYFGKLSVGKLDADTARELTVKLGIRNIPTILIYKDGEIVEKSVGSTTKEKLTNLIESQLS
jgi:thioredoxin 1